MTSAALMINPNCHSPMATWESEDLA